jgi:serine/threonine-protein kinase
MGADGAETLFDKVREAGLLEPGRLAELEPLPEARDPDPRALGRVLVQRGYLTRYQVSQLAAGRGRELLLGPYELLDKLGEGGMGQVFKARHRLMNRVVALKIIRKERLLDAAAVRRFNQEVQAAAQLSHPNIVTAFDSNQAGHQHYLAMEYVEGTDLARLVRQSGPLPVATACEYVRQAALGLQHAHEKGLVHRDIKPANLLLQQNSDQPTVKILDMGLARLAGERDRALTQSGQLLGTPDYLAPEQALNSRAVDIRADLYSLGGTLFFLLAARPPFQAETLAEVLLKHQMEEPASLRDLRPGVPEGVDAIVRRLLAKKPEDRFQSPADVAAVLRPFADESNAPTAIADPVPPPLPPKEASGSQTLTRPKPPGPGRRPMESATVKGASRTVSRRPRRQAGKNRGPLIAALCVSGALLVLLVVVAVVLSLRQAKTDATAAPDPLGLARRSAEQPRNPPVVNPQGGPEPPLRPRTPQAEPKPAPEPPPRPMPPPGPQLPPPANSPLDKLDPALIAPRDRYPGFPELVAVLGGHTDEVWGVAFAPDGKSIATALKDNHARLWDVSGNQPYLRFSWQGMGGPVASVAFRPDGRQLAFGTRNHIQFCDIANDGPAQVRLLPIGRASMPYVAYGKGGDLLAAAGDGGVWLLDVGGTGQPPHVVTGYKRRPRGVAVSRDGRTLALSTEDDFVRIWDLSGTPPRVKAAIPTASHPTVPALSPDGTTLAFGCFDGQVFCYDLSGPQPRERWSKQAHTLWANSVAFAPDGKTLVSTEGGDRRGQPTAIWWKVDGTKIREWTLPERCSQGAIDPSGRYLALACHDRNAYILRLPLTPE